MTCKNEGCGLNVRPGSDMCTDHYFIGRLTRMATQRDAAREEAMELRIEANLPEPWPFSWESGL